jgi:hypothetical protein
MEIQIPREVSPEDHDRYCRAFMAGYRTTTISPGNWLTSGEELRAIRDDYPDAFDAGVSAAWKRERRGA